MSRLEELIAEYCPDGVEYRRLGEIGTFYGGLSGKSKKDFEDGNAKFITYLNVYSNPSLDFDIKERVKILEGENFDIPQRDEDATYCKKISREEERLDFNDTAKHLHDKVRALNPSPLANVIINGEEWKVLETKIGNETKKIINSFDDNTVEKIISQNISKQYKYKYKKDGNLKDKIVFK